MAPAARTSTASSSSTSPISSSETEKKYGKVSAIGRQLGYNADDGTWSAFPDFYINFPGMYRKSMWDEIGMLPDTWDNLRKGGAKLKAKGHPVGISLGHSNDPSTTWRGLLWSYGASEQDEAGKKIILDSKETVEAAKYVAALYKEAMTSTCCRGMTPATTNISISGVGSYIINPISAYRTFQKPNKAGADDTFVMSPPKDRRGKSWAPRPNSTASGNLPRTRKPRSSS